MSQAVVTLGDGCFPAGTLITIATPVGLQERAIESLHPGELAQGPAGSAPLAAIAPCPMPDGPGAAILLRANAIAPGRPRQDLLVTPEQLLFVRDAQLPDGALVPAGALVNGRSVQRVPRPEGVAWFALGLEAHGLVVAAGQPASTRRAPGEALSQRLLPPGPGLFALRGRLTRAAPAPVAAAPAAPPEQPTPARSPAADAEPVFVDELPPGEAPDLRLVADGRLAPALPSESGAWCFRIPAGATTFRLLSPVGVPPDRPQGDADGRRFGVAIQSILLDGIPLDLGGRVAGDGFHAFEMREQHSWRWTDGNARLVLPPCAQPRRLEVTINDWHRLLRRA